MNRTLDNGIERRRTRQLALQTVLIGGGAPISVQSMTTTRNRDVRATLEQIEELAEAQCDIVRVAVPEMADAEALDEIVPRSPLPVVADIHFDHRLALRALEAGAHGLRLNPGNMRSRAHVEAVTREAAARNAPIRIGVNAGSLSKTYRDRMASGELSLPQAMVESALEHIAILEELEFRQIKVSLKASDILNTVRAYRLLAGRCDYPFHVGVTEAGTVRSGTIKSSAGIGILLMDGLCDTIRVSLTGLPAEEARVGSKLLQAFGERQAGPNLISCPTCGRRDIDIFALAERVEALLDRETAPLNVAVMGCEVNGPGEARHADIGIAGGKGEGIIFRDGKIVRRAPEAQLYQAFLEEFGRLKAERGLQD
ncbi:MAG: 4-hydroxy-3-methylbut-2-en-1-yl diphosphate synthase [candidate division BRC1 bacterium ADurb.BinA364]|nr:MAG: 4-hydroxy-3-methylbut-2-en-1-yl diphosphate synthase [candidate division BRC1 bacterium ADurb.BinA364]